MKIIITINKKRWFEKPVILRLHDKIGTEDK